MRMTFLIEPRYPRAHGFECHWMSSYRGNAKQYYTKQFDPQSKQSDVQVRHFSVSHGYHKKAWLAPDTRKHGSQCLKTISQLIPIQASSWARRVCAEILIGVARLWEFGAQKRATPSGYNSAARQSFLTNLENPQGTSLILVTAKMNRVLNRAI